MTIEKGFLFDKERVQLFSRPQHKQAIKAKRLPNEKEIPSLKSKESKMLDKVTNIIPIQRFLPILSLKISKAIKLVATISKLLINEIELLGELEMDNNSIIGAIISKTIIQITYFNSFLVIFSCSIFFLSTVFLKRLTKLITIPAPR